MAARARNMRDKKPSKIWIEGERDKHKGGVKQCEIGKP